MTIDPIHPPILEVTGLTMRFGGILALNDISFAVKCNSISALIGPNGAGKTTVFNCLTGFYKATEGRIALHTPRAAIDLISILGQPFKASDFINPAVFADRLYYKMFGGTHRVTRAGVARTFQNVRLFKEMTAIENLLVAQHLQLNRNLLAGLLRTAAYRQSERDALERAYAWLQVFGLAEDANLACRGQACLRRFCTRRHTARLRRDAPRGHHLLQRYVLLSRGGGGSGKLPRHARRAGHHRH